MINAIPEPKKSHTTLLISLGLAAAGAAALAALWITGIPEYSNRLFNLPPYRHESSLK